MTISQSQSSNHTIKTVAEAEKLGRIDETAYVIETNQYYHYVIGSLAPDDTSILKAKGVNGLWVKRGSGRNQMGSLPKSLTTQGVYTADGANMVAYLPKAVGSLNRYLIIAEKGGKGTIIESGDSINGVSGASYILRENREAVELIDHLQGEWISKTIGVNPENYIQLSTNDTGAILENGGEIVLDSPNWDYSGNMQLIGGETIFVAPEDAVYQVIVSYISNASTDSNILVNGNPVSHTVADAGSSLSFHHTTDLKKGDKVAVTLRNGASIKFGQISFRRIGDISHLI